MAVHCRRSDEDWTITGVCPPTSMMCNLKLFSCRNVAAGIMRTGLYVLCLATIMRALALSFRVTNTLPATMSFGALLPAYLISKVKLSEAKIHYASSG